MRDVRYTGQFKRDTKRMQKRGKDFSRLRVVIESPAQGEALDPKLRDHPLLGGYAGSRERHIEPDWLLIYERTDGQVTPIHVQAGFRPTPEST